MRLFKKLFSFFWDRSLLIFLIIGGLNTLVSMVGSQLLYGALGYCCLLYTSPSPRD